MPVTVKSMHSAKVYRPAVAAGKVFTTVDGGRLHVAVGNRYAGSINCYNNWFTKFFAGIFGWSEKIIVNDKTRHVSKSDYIEFLTNSTSYTEATVANIKEYVDFNALKVQPAHEKGTMRQNISQSKADYLFKKLVTAIVDTEDAETAQKLIGKGAHLDQQFWFREGFGVSYTNLTEALPKERALNLKAGHYTPLLYTAAKSNNLLAQYICFFNPNLEMTGEVLQFERRISEVHPVRTVVNSEDFTSTDGRRLIRQTIKTSTVLRMQDIKTPIYQIHFNPDDCSLVWAESRDRTVVENYDYASVRYTTEHV